MFNNEDMDIYSMSKEEQKTLYDKAKSAYYTGNPIMEDFEFDALELLLGFENKSKVGSSEEDNIKFGSTKKYTVKHPFIMGSLSKIQFRKDKKTDNINWDDCQVALQKYVTATKKNNKYFKVEPKYDGCSFEAIYHNGLLDKCSTRGDGEWGQDITDWISCKLPNVVTNSEIANSSLVTVRGEVLIKISTFEEKYINENANPRSFVSGYLNSDFSFDKIEIRNDLDVICYDFRDVIKHKVLNTYNFYNEFNLPEVDCVIDISLSNVNDFLTFKSIYERMYDFRINKSKYQLDGYVWKPEDMQFEENDIRPLDCVAFKFLPEIVQTEIIDIEWNLGKSMEYYPVAILKPVQLMGTEVKRASLYNYEFVIKNLIMPGSIVNICKSGDIIPQIIEVVSIPDDITFCESIINAPIDFYIEESYSQNGKILVRHMMKKLEGKELTAHQFRASVKSLNIPSIGPANAEILVQSECNNILELLYNKNEDWIKEKFGYLKTGDIIIYELKNKIAKITLEEIIQSMNIPLCGKRVSEQCAIYLQGGVPNFSSMPEKAYSWIYTDTKEKKYLLKLILIIGFIMPVYKTDSRIPIIMTGEPIAFGFKTKGEFLEKHPEYRNTTSWKEVKIVFTDDLTSNTGKMQKAIKNNIPVKLYQ